MTEPTTIRDALEAAVPQDEELLSSAPTESAPEPTVEASASDVAEAAAAVEEARSEPAEKPAEKTTKASRKRASDGKFEKTDDAPSVRQAVEQLESTPAIQPGPKAEPPKEKAPASWRPEVREHWANIPPEVRAEVARREAEVQRTLQETAEARRFTEQLQNVIRPYEMFIKAENSNPLQAIDNLMATAARLRTGTAPELASMVAGIVKQFGVGRFGNNFIEQLDSALAGEVPRTDPVQTQVQQVLQQQLAPVQQFMSQFQQQQLAAQQQAQQQAVGEVQQFISKAEFGEDVREEMADIMELAQRRGREVSLQDAYRQACLVNPKVRSVLEARAKAKGAAQLTGAAQKAKSAAVSVSGGPALSAPPSQAKDIRTAIEAALASYER
jgi:hypothetical protein